MFLLDTNVVSELMRPKPEPSVEAWVAGRPPKDLFLSAVSEAELPSTAVWSSTVSACATSGTRCSRPAFMRQRPGCRGKNCYRRSTRLPRCRRLITFCRRVRDLAFQNERSKLSAARR